jgi:hypothetical protein
MNNKAPCGHNRMNEMIRRSTRFLFPTAFVNAECMDCSKTWTERYEFDFDVPINGKSWEDQED